MIGNFYSCGYKVKLKTLDTSQQIVHIISDFVNIFVIVVSFGCLVGSKVSVRRLLKNLS